MHVFAVRVVSNVIELLNISTFLEVTVIISTPSQHDSSGVYRLINTPAFVAVAVLLTNGDIPARDGQKYYLKG